MGEVILPRKQSGGVMMGPDHQIMMSMMMILMITMIKMIMILMIIIMSMTMILMITMIIIIKRSWSMNKLPVGKGVGLLLCVCPPRSPPITI